VKPTKHEEQTAAATNAYTLLLVVISSVFRTSQNHLFHSAHS